MALGRPHDRFVYEPIEGLHGSDVGWQEQRNFFRMNIDFISQKRETVLFLPSNMAVMQSFCKEDFCLLVRSRIRFTCVSENCGSHNFLERFVDMNSRLCERIRTKSRSRSKLFLAWARYPT